jgi:hypothetical protein
MPEHYQRWVTETLSHCNTCRRITKHAVSGGRLGHCLEHTPKVNARGESKTQEKRRQAKEKAEQNPTSF